MSTHSQWKPLKSSLLPSRKSRNLSIHHSHEYLNSNQQYNASNSIRFTHSDSHTFSPSKLLVSSPKYFQHLEHSKKMAYELQYPIREFAPISTTYEPPKNTQMGMKLSNTMILSRQSHGARAEQLKQTLSTRAGYQVESQRQGSITDFQIIKDMGMGKFSKVSIVRHRQSGFVAAMKTLPKKNITDESLVTQLLREVKILSYVNHPHIVSLYSVYGDSENIYLIQELGCDGELYSFLCRRKKFSEEGTSFIMRSLLEAVSYLHTHKILHRDIKPQNVVVVHGIVKLCDLGWSVHTRSKFRQTLCGTPLYSSPQLLQGEKYNEKIDLWALGIMSYELRFGHAPFNVKNKNELYKIITDDIDFSVQQVSEEFEHFTKSLLQKNPKERLTAQMMLRHPFILKYQAFETCEQLCLP